MSKLNTVEDLLAQEIKDLFSAESQLVKALPKVADAASSPELREAVNTHLEETKVHVTRLEQVAELLGITPRGKTCKAMRGLLEEGGEVIDEDGDPSIKDLALITAAQKVEHYEIASYGSARAMSELLGLDDVTEILTTTLDEESHSDSHLIAIAEHIGQEFYSEYPVDS
jgi:ferritin-like metal-binding protein YciE